LIECPDVATARQLLSGIGIRDGVVPRWQRRGRFALAALAGVVLVGIAGYLWGLPWASDRIAASLPPSWPEVLGREALRSLDTGVFKPSGLATAEQDSIRESYRQFLAPTGATAATIEFRRVTLGPNAFAFPGNTIIVGDELVSLARKTRDPQVAILGVLAHEQGHLEHRHPMRNFVRGTLLAAIAAWWIGDISTVLAGAAPVLLGARYTRAFEQEADRFAAEKLHASAASVEPLIELLTLLDAAGRSGASERDKDTAPEKKSPERQTGYFSTHPGVEERIAALRTGPADAK
jgi:Zn-dependent protease with chaperone function